MQGGTRYYNPSTFKSHRWKWARVRGRDPLEVVRALADQQERMANDNGERYSHWLFCRHDRGRGKYHVDSCFFGRKLSSFICDKLDLFFESYGHT